MWILILTINMFNSTGVTTIEFNSKTTCESAIEQMKQIEDYNTRVIGVCVERKR